MEVARSLVLGWLLALVVGYGYLLVFLLRRVDGSSGEAGKSEKIKHGSNDGVSASLLTTGRMDTSQDEIRKTGEGTVQPTVQAFNANEAGPTETEPPSQTQKVLLNSLTTINGTLLKTSAGRPLAEPPIFNYERFADEFLTSEKKLKVIFPDDPVTKTKFQDIEAEKELLGMHLYWCKKKCPWDFYEPIQDMLKANMFYTNLEEQIRQDWVTLSNEAVFVDSAPTELAKWEGRTLDSEGGTKDLERDLLSGMNIFDIHYRNNNVHVCKLRTRQSLLRPRESTVVF